MTEIKKSLLIHPEELTYKWIDRAKTIGLHTLALHPRGGPEAAKTLEEMLCWMDGTEFCAKLDYAVRLGLKLEYEFHAASWLLPRELFDSHPEYFRMDENGRRVREINFCATDPDALRIVSERAEILAGRLYRSEPNFYFWLDDAKKGTCRCPRCAALSPSDIQMTVCNAMIREIRKSLPEAKLAFLSYQDTLTPPLTVAPEDGIFLEFAPIERDVHTPVELDSGVDKDKLSRMLDFIGKRDAKVLEYWYDNSLFSGWKKPPKRFVPDGVVIKRDIRYYQSLGFENIASFACFLGEDYEALYGEPQLDDFI